MPTTHPEYQGRGYDGAAVIVPEQPVLAYRFPDGRICIGGLKPEGAEFLAFVGLLFTPDDARKLRKALKKALRDV